jgi:hypothetical protein
MLVSQGEFRSAAARAIVGVRARVVPILHAGSCADHLMTCWFTREGRFH